MTTQRKVGIGIGIGVLVIGALFEFSGTRKSLTKSFWWNDVSSERPSPARLLELSRSIAQQESTPLRLCEVIYNKESFEQEVEPNVQTGEVSHGYCGNDPNGGLVVDFRFGRSKLLNNSVSSFKTPIHGVEGPLATAPCDYESMRSVLQRAIPDMTGFNARLNLRGAVDRWSIQVKRGVAERRSLELTNAACLQGQLSDPIR